MNSISKDGVKKRRQDFIADVSGRIDQFCEFATRHHPKSLPCEPFTPNGQDNFIKHGGFNLCVFIQFKTCPPERWVIRVPFPHSPCVVERMSSEIATMIYVAAKTTIPVPQVHAYSLSDDNTIKSPSLIINYIEGKTLREFQFQFPLKTPDSHVRKVYQQLSEIHLQLCQLEFPTIGALGLPQGSTERLTACNANSITVQNRPLTLHMALQAAEGYEPDTIIEPEKTYHTAREFVAALIGLSENQFDRSSDVILDERRGPPLLYSRDAFHRFASKEWLEVDGPFVLLHGDITMHNHNILFDQDFKAVAVIDWEFSFVGPIQLLVPPVWLTGGGFGLMLLDINWYKEEVARLFHEVKQSEAAMHSTTSLARVWETFPGLLGTAVATGLLHPDHIYDTFWEILFWHIHGLDPYDRRFDMVRHPSELIFLLIKDFMTPDKVKLLERKRREQDNFWQREQEFFGLKQKPQFWDDYDLNSRDENPTEEEETSWS